MSDYLKEIEQKVLFDDTIILKEFINTIKTRLIDYTQNQRLDAGEFCAYQDVLSWIKTFENNTGIVFNE